MRKLLNLLPWNRRRLDHDLAREIDYHLDRRIADLMRSGWSAADARRAAGRELGGVTQVQEQVRDVWTWPWTDHLLRDLRYSIRTLRRSPGLTATAVLSLALGIGANTAIFSLADQVLLRTLPVPEPDRLVHLGWRGPSLASEWGAGNLVSYALCKELQEQTQVLDGAFCRHPTSVDFATADTPTPIRSEIVSGSFFRVLGVRAERGRLIEASDDGAAGTHPVVVLSYNFWMSQFGGAPDVVGRKVFVSNYPMTVIGVASRTFVGVDPVQGPALWIPASMTPQVSREIGPRFMDRRTAWMHAVARLKPGLTPEDAEARLRPWFKTVVESESQLEGFPRVSAEMRRQFLASTIAVDPAARGLSDQRYQLSRPLRVLLAATALLLLLACLNVAGLLLARGAARSRELTTRVALGASRGQITSQILIESTLVVLAGATLGMVVAPVTSRTLLSFFAQGLDVPFRFDVRIFAFTLLVCVAAAALCGLAPVWRVRRMSLVAGFGERSGSATAGGVRLRKAIVTAQMAFTLILLIGAGLFAQTLAHLRAKDLGFASSQLAMFGVDPRPLGYSDSSAVQIVRDLVRRMEQVPGVERAAVANASLLTGSGFRRALTIGGAERVVTAGAIPGLRVSPGFFATVGTRLIAGRDFDERDVPKPGATYRSMIVNESFARHYFGTRNPVGQRVGLGSQPTTPVDIEIIGVTQDINYRTLREHRPEQLFLPFGAPGSLSADGTIFVKVRGEPTAAFASIRAGVAEIDKRLPMNSLTTLDDQRDRMLRSERMLAILSSGFGTIALLLSMIGLYGIVSFVVTGRTREIGLRLAIGATPSDAVWLITRGALRMVVVGMVIALPASIALGRVVESQLFGVDAFHVPTIGAACLILGMVAVGAALIPAWRAASINPIEALRLE